MGNLLYKKFGLRVKELRKTHKLSQSQLGAQSNLEKTAIQRIERGYNSTLSTLNKLAEGFNISLPELLDIDNNYQNGTQRVVVTDYRKVKQLSFRSRNAPKSRRLFYKHSIGKSNVSKMKQGFLTQEYDTSNKEIAKKSTSAVSRVSNLSKKRY